MSRSVLRSLVETVFLWDVDKRCVVFHLHTYDFCDDDWILESYAVVVFKLLQYKLIVLEGCSE